MQKADESAMQTSEKIQFIYVNQNGFGKDRSTMTAIANLLEYYEDVNKRKRIRELFVDFRNAFGVVESWDTVALKILELKINSTHYQKHIYLQQCCNGVVAHICY